MSKSALRILLVEDNDDLRQAMTLALENSGFFVDAVPCAEDLDEAVTHAPADVFVVDLNLPGEDGLSLSKRLRRAYPHVGIIMATARTQLNDKVQGYESGADLYMAKPFDFAELVAALSAFSRRIDSAVAQRAEWVLNMATERFSGPLAEVKLTASEARLMAAFAAARHSALEGWQVMHHLVGPERDLNANSLHFRISTLRKKIVACGAVDNPIISMRREGYKCPLHIQVVSQ